MVCVDMCVFVFLCVFELVIVWQPSAPPHDTSFHVCMYVRMEDSLFNHACDPNVVLVMGEGG